MGNPASNPVISPTTWIEVLADIAAAADLLAQVRAEFWRRVEACLPEVMG